MLDNLQIVWREDYGGEHSPHVLSRFAFSIHGVAFLPRYDGKANVKLPVPITRIEGYERFVERIANKLGELRVAKRIRRGEELNALQYIGLAHRIGPDEDSKPLNAVQMKGFVIPELTKVYSFNSQPHKPTFRVFFALDSHRHYQVQVSLIGGTANDAWFQGTLQFQTYLIGIHGIQPLHHVEAVETNLNI